MAASLPAAPFLTSLRTTQKPCCNLVRNRWCIESWHWIRDTQLPVKMNTVWAARSGRLPMLGHVLEEPWPLNLASAVTALLGDWLGLGLSGLGPTIGGHPSTACTPHIWA